MAALISALFFILVTFTSGQVTKYKLCVPNTMVAQCENLDRADSEVTCVLVQDSTECSLKLNRGEVDFGKFSAEQALVASYFLQEGTSGVTVIGDIRDEEKQYNEFAFTAVAVARRRSIPSGNMGREQKLKLCHPGVGRIHSGWSDRVLRELDLAALDSVSGRLCDEWRSELENQYVSIAKFWGDSCRPGNWAADRDMDQKLKTQNPSLCERCPNKVACSYGSGESDPHMGAMTCLQQGGDVAFVDQSFAQDLIATMTPGGGEWALVCPDLSLGINVTSCHWAQQPWSPIVSRSSVARTLNQKLNLWLTPLHAREMGVTEPMPRRIGGWQRALIDILLDDYQIYKSVQGTDMTVKKFMTRGRRIPDATTEHSCNGPTRWCSQQEQERAKCEWLSTAALTAGVVPPIKCLGAESGLACAKLLGNHQADITVTNIDDAHIASTWTPETSDIKLRIEVNKYVETSSEKHGNVVTLVRSDYQLHNVTDLKGKKACFPIKDGIAYGSFLKFAMELHELPNACPYENAVQEYFGSSCVPGASPNVTGLCELCQSNTGSGGVDPYGFNKPPNKCAAHEGNLFYNNVGALRCLHSGGGDVAYVELGAVREAIAQQTVPGIQESDFKVVCGTGQIMPVTQSGLVGAEKCALSTVPAGAVLCRASLEPHAWKDVHNVLLSSDALFGTTDGSHPEPVFRMYRPFNNTKGLIFPFGTVGMLAKDSKVPAVEGFMALTVKVPQPCGSGDYNAATSSVASASFVILATIILAALRVTIS